MKKMLLLIIGKSANPRCSNGSNVSDLKVLYSNSPRTWKHQSIFSSWLEEFNEYISKTSGRKVALLIENASSHCCMEDITSPSNVEVIYLTKNTASF